MTAHIQCVTGDHAHVLATRMVRVMDGPLGVFPYCNECAELLVRNGIGEDSGPSNDVTAAERDRYREALVEISELHLGDSLTDACQIASKALDAPESGS